MNFDFDNCVYLGCIPWSAWPYHPEDQINCKLRKCKHCNERMWVSEKKRNLKKQNPLKYKICCLLCIYREGLKQGYSPDNIEILDINKIT